MSEASAQAVRWRQVPAWIFHTPLTALALYVVLSLVLRENYPFSNFPMYANPADETGYLQIVDGEGKALPVAVLTGLTNPKIGKIFRRKRQEREARIKDESAEIRERAAGREVLQYLREQAGTRNRELPPVMELRSVRIRVVDGKVQETFSTIASD